LELDPGGPGSRIVGHLFHASLEDNPAFEALSYTWGFPSPTYDITIDGHAFPVARNLRKALDDLRREDRPRVIWTDAICINQRDNDEKAHQIRLMRGIFSSAHLVCTWTDHNVQPMGPVFDDLDSLGEEGGVDISDFSDPSYWYPVADIFRVPYWRRLWVQQELVLARNINVYCRRDVLDGTKLLEFQHRINVSHFEVTSLDRPEREILKYVEGSAAEPGNHAQVFSGGILRARRNLALGRESHGENADKIDRLVVSERVLGSSLLQLFLYALGLDMVDPRDRVYGILGMAADVDLSSFDVDYGAPVMTVYTQVFRHFLVKYKSLSFLAFDSERDNTRVPEREGFPSWMPHTLMPWSAISYSRACGDTLADRARIDPGRLILSAEGIHCDTISFMEPRRFTPADPIVDWLSQVEDMCRRLWPEAEDRPFYERDDVSDLFFPWISQERFKKAYGGTMKKPDAEQRAEWIRDMVFAAGKVDNPEDFSLLSIFNGSYQPDDVLLPETRTAIMYPFQGPATTKLFGTKGGRLGKISQGVSAALGDQIWVIFGCRMPLILRPEAGDDGQFKVIGPAILPPIMRGEALEENGDTGRPRGQIIQLV
jgi:hypothetical protein